jgi:small GTP-binding protein
MTSKKIILTGSFGVGKTSLFNRFLHNKFDGKYLSTIGVVVNKRVVAINGEDVSLLIWDIQGEVTQDKVPHSYFIGAHGIIYVFDLSRPITHKHIEADIQYLKKMVPDSIVRIVGNKKDLLSDASLEILQAELPLSWDIVTSAKSGEGVEDLFYNIATAML